MDGSMSESARRLIGMIFVCLVRQSGGSNRGGRRSARALRETALVLAGAASVCLSLMWVMFEKLELIQKYHAVQGPYPRTL